MLVKFLMINPHHPLLNPDNKDQQMIIAADKEALEAIGNAALQAVEADEQGVQVTVRDATEFQQIVYRFTRLPDELLRQAMADNN